METNANINRVLIFIDKHLKDTITSDELARVAGYSEYHFIRVFKLCMNVKPMDYVRKRRLIKASEAIIDGMKIIDVAMEYGWQSHSGFTKAFIKEFGFQPSLLRAMIIGIECLGGRAMNHVYLESTAIGSEKEALFELLKKKIRENSIEIEDTLLTEMYECACSAYEGVKRYSGEEYVTHPLNVAIILTELGTEAPYILAGMLCDISGKGVLSLEKLKDRIPPEIYKITEQCQGVGSHLASAPDGIIIIKLAERLHNMRTIDFIDERKRSQKARETIELFMPFAIKSGNRKLIDELNDLGLKYYAAE